MATYKPFKYRKTYGKGGLYYVISKEVVWSSIMLLVALGFMFGFFIAVLIGVVLK